MQVVVTAALPGHARPALLYQGPPVPAATVKHLSDYARKQGGKATVCVDGAKVTTIGQYQRRAYLNATDGEWDGPVTEVKVARDVTQPVLSAAHKVARLQQFQGRINWVRFFEVMETMVLADGSQLRLGEGSTPAKDFIGRAVRRQKALERRRKQR